VTPLVEMARQSGRGDAERHGRIIEMLEDETS
jgi:hypothetical protein